jgi:prepilin-type N-terminal cleavage/methylation domain-containing protein
VRRAFTLVEIMIVVLVLAILASLVVPTLANAAAPLPRAIADLLEADFRRARIESLGSVREIHMVIGGDRDRWWLQPAGAPRQAATLPSSMRVLGNGNLAPFAGCTREPIIDTNRAPTGPVAFALFSPDGLRSDTRLDLALVGARGAGTLLQWRVAPQRSQLIESTASQESQPAPAGNGR